MEIKSFQQVQKIRIFQQVQKLYVAIRQVFKRKKLGSTVNNIQQASREKKLIQQSTGDLTLSHKNIICQNFNQFV
jgi:hypothetical protein